MNIVFMGTPQAAVPALDRILADGHEIAAVYTQPDRASGRGNKITFSPVKQFATEHDLTVLQPSQIRAPETFEKFVSHHADVVVVVAYGRILPESFLTAFPAGAINVHFSLLPKYRGAAPVNWAIVNGDERTGVTTMKMDAGLDTGDILLQAETVIGNSETSIELTARLAVQGAELLSETLAKMASINPSAQDHGSATLAPILMKEDGRFDWSLTANEIINRIRGFQPFPTTYTFLDGKRLTLWKAAKSDADCIEPGMIIEAGGDELIVGCGSETALRIIELQPEGKRKMSARDFLNGSKLKIGDRMN